MTHTVSAAVVLLTLVSGAAAQPDPTAHLERIPAASVNLPWEATSDGHAPFEEQRVCFEPGAYVLALAAVPVTGAAAVAMVTGAHVIIGEDDAQRWGWSVFEVVGEGAECLELMVGGIGAQARVYRLQLAW